MYAGRKETNVTKIEWVELVGEETKEKSGVGRAVVGGLLFGGAGAIVGAITKKDKQYAVFEVTYSNGKTEEVKCKKGSFLYNTYMGIYRKQEREYGE